MVLIWIELFLVSWLAASISGVAGFGGALLLLPILTGVLGAKAAIPVLTIAQLFGNASRAAFGFREIRWRPVVYFVAGAIPASIIGSRLFVDLPRGQITTGIGLFLVLVILMRRLKVSLFKKSLWWLVPGGALVGFLSAVVGSAGPLGAAFFLGLNLPPVAYVASEAVTSVAIHVTKTVVYQRYALLGADELILGTFLGGAMVLGSWTGKKMIDHLPRAAFSLVVEILLLLSAAQLIFTK